MTGSRRPSINAHMIEPGKAAPLVRMAISMSNEDSERLMRLIHHLEAKANKRLSASEVVRQSISCLATQEGVA